MGEDLFFVKIVLSLYDWWYSNINILITEYLHTTRDIKDTWTLHLKDNLCFHQLMNCWACKEKNKIELLKILFECLIQKI